MADKGTTKADEGRPNINEKGGETRGTDSDQSRQADTDVHWDRVIDHSPNSARLVVYASNDFVSDRVLEMVGGQRRGNTNGLVLLANTLNWSVDDSGLMSIRSRSHFNRTLPPMEQDQQQFWEYLNYALSILLLAVIGGGQFWRRRFKQRRYEQLLAD